MVIFWNEFAHYFVETEDSFSFFLHTFAFAEQVCSLNEIFGSKMGSVQINFINFMYIFIDLEWGVIVDIFDRARFDDNTFEESGVIDSVEYGSLAFKKQGHWVV